MSSRKLNKTDRIADVTIGLRVSAADKARWQIEAQKRGISMTAFIYQAVQSAIQSPSK